MTEMVKVNDRYVDYFCYIGGQRRFCDLLSEKVSRTDYGFYRVLGRSFVMNKL